MSQPITSQPAPSAPPDHTEVITAQPNNVPLDLPPSYNEAVGQPMLPNGTENGDQNLNGVPNRVLEEHREVTRHRREEQCCLDYTDDPGPFCCYALCQLFSHPCVMFCRAVAECTDSCCENCAECLNNSCSGEDSCGDGLRVCCDCTGEGDCDCGDCGSCDCSF